MTNTHRPFARTIQHSEEWVRDVMRELGTEDFALALAALRGTLHALRDRITPVEAVQLGAQLPELLRGLYYDGFTIGAPHTRTRTASAFLTEAYGLSGRSDLDPERAVRAVFRVLDRRVSAGEIDDVIGDLPKRIAELWD